MFLFCLRKSLSYSSKLADVTPLAKLHRSRKQQGAAGAFQQAQEEIKQATMWGSRQHVPLRLDLMIPIKYCLICLIKFNMKAQNKVVHTCEGEGKAQKICTFFFLSSGTRV